MQRLKDKLTALGQFIAANPEFYDCSAVVDGWRLWWRRYDGAFELSVSYQIFYPATKHRRGGTWRDGYRGIYQSQFVHKCIAAAIHDLPQSAPTKAPRDLSYSPKNLDGMEFNADITPFDEIGH